MPTWVPRNLAVAILALGLLLAEERAFDAGGPIINPGLHAQANELVPKTWDFESTMPCKGDEIPIWPRLHGMKYSMGGMPQQ